MATRTSNKTEFVSVVLQQFTSRKTPYTPQQVTEKVQKTFSDISQNAVSTMLCRLQKNSKFIHRSRNRSNKGFLYWFEKRAPVEEQPFWDVEKPLYIHDICIVGKKFPIEADYTKDFKFLERKERIKIQLCKNTKKITIRFGCGKLGHPLDNSLFLALIEKIYLFLEMYSWENYFDRLKVVTAHYNQDSAANWTRIEGTPCISLQTTQNIILKTYKKNEETIRNEAIVTQSTDIKDVTSVLDSSKRKVREASFFARGDNLLRQIPPAMNQMFHKFNIQHESSMNTTQLVEEKFLSAVGNLNRAATSIEEQLTQVPPSPQLGNSDEILARQINSEIISKQVASILENIHLSQENQATREDVEMVNERVDRLSHSLNSNPHTERIISLINEGYTTQKEIAAQMGVTVSAITSPLRKIVQEGSIEVTYNPTKQRGRPTKHYRVI